MQHIMQISFDFDDESISKKVEDQGYNDIIKILVNEARQNLPKKSYSSKNIDWYSIARDVINDIFDNNKDKIIEMAAKLLAEKYYASKAFKTKMAEAAEEIISES